MTSMTLTTCLLLLACLAPLAAEEAPAAPLTLAAAIAASQAEHPDAAEAEARVAESQARLRQATAVLLPRLAVESSYMVTDQPALAFMALIDHDAYAPAINPNQPPTVDNLNLGADLQLPLYAPGSWSARRAAQHEAATALDTRDAVRNALAMAAVRAFIGVHRALARIDAAEASEGAAVANLEAARTRSSVGSLSTADLLGLEAQLAGARSQTAAAHGGLDLAGQALAAACGRDGSITQVAAMPDLVAPTQERSGEQPEQAAAREQAASAEAGLDQARAQRLPRVSAFGGYAYDRGFRQEGDGESWHAGVGLEWTIFSGGAVEDAIVAAAARRTSALAQARRTTLIIDHGRAAARIRLATISRQLSAVSAQLAAAMEAERLQAERFRAGQATASDIAVAEASLAEARAAVADAQADQSLAITDLRWRYGLPILAPAGH